MIPKKYWDTVFGGIGAPRNDFVWDGVDNHLLNKNMVQLLDEVTSRYNPPQVDRNGDGVIDDNDLTSDEKKIKKDFDELYSYKQAAEQALTANPGDPYNIYNKIGSVGTSYIIGEYGKVEREFQHNGQLGQGDTSLPVANSGTYNNRNYGYRYANGTYTTIKLTMNGREYTLQETIFTSPIVLDMNGDGKLEASSGHWLPHTYKNGKVVEFDIDGDGFMELTEWVGANDGILLVHKEGEEISANNLFGTAGGFNHGYEKLSLLDADNDGKLSGDELATLSVWQDKNTDGKVDASEIASVQSLGITSISLKHDAQLVSSFEQNGVTKKVWDWYPTVFRVKRKQ